MADNNYFRVSTTFDSLGPLAPDPVYGQAIRNGINHALTQVLPEQYFDLKWQSERLKENVRKKLLAQLPLVKSAQRDRLMCFYTLFQYRANAFKFFFDLVSQWLVPGRRLNVILVYAADFQFPELGDDLFTVCEVIIQIEDLNDIELIQRNFPIIETEALLGIESEYYARKILEVRGMSPDQKTSLIQHRIAVVLNRLPEFFSADVFTEMQHILVLCDEDFKDQRSVSHLSRLIGIHYLFRRRLLDLIKEFAHKRHVLVKCFKSTVNFPNGKKNVLALIIGFNFLRGKEIFEQRHLLKAIKRYIPSAEAIDQTFFTNRRGSEKITTVYIEIEKTDNKKFSSEEIRKLKSYLPDDLQSHIGHLLPPVFMPRNEEEIMRNILSLSQQLKYLRDIPQVFISFDEQTERNLFFTVIVVRIFRKGAEPIADLIRRSGTFLRYIHDRTKIVGALRQKHPKEATVFRLKFSKDSFLRGDHSIDLYKARQAVVNELTRAMGEFRDFNGGMISKQNELLIEVKALFAKEGVKYNEIFLEDFFYSLAPVIMRTVLESHAFKSLFQMVLESLNEGVGHDEKVSVKWRQENHFIYLMTVSPNWTMLDEISRILHKHNHGGTDLVQGYVKTSEFICMGYVYRSMDVKKQEQFKALIENQFGQ